MVSAVQIVYQRPGADFAESGRELEAPMDRVFAGSPRRVL
jgi:hypothetical protein